MTVPWLWLYGPPGVGKSSTGFEVFRRLIERGERVAFIELDQIGMCMPAPAVVRSAAKLENLLGMLDNFATAGAQGVVVCGDMAETMREVLARAPEPPVLCRLRAGDDVTYARLGIRGSVQYAMPSRVYEANDVPPGDLDITTEGLGVDGVAAEVLRQLARWPRPAATSRRAAPAPEPPLEWPRTVLVTGPRVSGTSTVAWQVLTASMASGHRTGYLDLEQLAFLSPNLRGASPSTILANVAACWAGFGAQRTERLVLCGHAGGVAVSALRDLIPSLRVAALTANRATLLARATRRRGRKDIWLPGDDLYGCDDFHLLQVVEQAAAFDPGGVDLLVETDRRSPADIAARVAPLWDMAARAAEDVTRSGEG